MWKLSSLPGDSMPLPFDSGLKPAAPRKAAPALRKVAENGMVNIEVPEEFWRAIEDLAQQAGVTPETVISAGTSLYALAIKAKAEHQKLAVVELDQPCITEIKGL